MLLNNNNNNRENVRRHFRNWFWHTPKLWLLLHEIHRVPENSYRFLYVSTRAIANHRQILTMKFLTCILQNKSFRGIWTLTFADSGLHVQPASLENLRRHAIPKWVTFTLPTKNPKQSFLTNNSNTFYSCSRSIHPSLFLFWYDVLCPCFLQDSSPIRLQ